MKRLFWLTPVLLISLFMARVYFGHESRTMTRLKNAGIVVNPEESQWVYSTGYLRENTHVFQTSRKNVVWSRFFELDDSEIRPWPQHRLHDFPDALKRVFSSEDRVCYEAASEKDDPGILWSAEVIAGETDQVWVVLHIF